jgi:hypothetical protein
MSAVDAAAWLGHHATVLFGAMMLAVLAATAGVWWLLQRLHDPAP